MPRIDLIVESPISDSSRVSQLSAMFDAPLGAKSRLEWHGELPIEDAPWNVGLIVGPSGCGKTSIGSQLFAEHYEAAVTWGAPSVIDDFSAQYGIGEVASICQAVGFNTIPAWARPYRVLSNGERFRVELARRLLELPDPVVVDEFTSVVDRQVAQIGAHAVQKYVRKHKRQFVALSCHYDIIDWLQPDWIFEPATMHFARRSLQRRPPLDVTISRVPYSAWQLFAPFHYLTAELHRSARCFGLWVADRLAAFAGVINMPVSRGQNSGDSVKMLSRLVTLPDWQGLGLAFVLSERLGAAYKALGLRYRNYPAHPSFVRAYKPETWELLKQSGSYSARNADGHMGGRPCAVLEYIGPALPLDEARALLGQ